jgi:peptide/nickel transport system permease protein
MEQRSQVTPVIRPDFEKIPVEDSQSGIGSLITGDLSELPEARLKADSSIRSSRKFRSNKLLTAGTLIILFFVTAALTAPLLTRLGWLADPIRQEESGLDADGMPLPPGRTYWLGTDGLGRDILARVLHGARVSLTVGTAAMVTATIIGVIVGLCAGFFGGVLDLGLMRFSEMCMTIPAILLAIAFAGLLDVQGRLIHLHPAALPWHALDFTLKRGMVTLFLVIGFVSWPGMVRVIRAQVLSLKERDSVQAAHALGASNLRVIFRYILPHLLPTIIVLSAMNTANAILLEAGLSYLGIGVPAPAPTWGSMISDGQAYFLSAPGMVVAPGVAIVLTVVGFNLIGQGLQEALDNRSRR